MPAMTFNSDSKACKLLNSVYYLADAKTAKLAGGVNGFQFIAETLDGFFRLPENAAKRVTKHRIEERMKELFADPLPSSGPKRYARDDEKRRTSSKSSDRPTKYIDKELGIISLAAMQSQREVFSWASKQRTLARLLRKIGMKTNAEVEKTWKTLLSNLGALALDPVPEITEQLKQRYFTTTA